MGAFFMWFQKDNVAELKVDREKLVEKKMKLEQEIFAIDERIAELESKNKDNN